MFFKTNSTLGHMEFAYLMHVRDDLYVVLCPNGLFQPSTTDVYPPGSFRFLNKCEVEALTMYEESQFESQLEDCEWLNSPPCGRELI